MIMLCALQISRVNAEAIRYPIDYYDIGQDIPLEGCFIDTAEELTEGYVVRVDEVQLMSYNDFVRAYAADPTSTIQELDTPSVACLTVTITNNATDPIRAGALNMTGIGLIKPRYPFFMTIDTALWARAEVNMREGQTQLPIAPQSSYTTHIPFTAKTVLEDITDEYAAYLQEIPRDTYELRLSEVPRKKVVRIEIPAD